MLNVSSTENKDFVEHNIKQIKRKSRENSKNKKMKRKRSRDSSQNKYGKDRVGTKIVLRSKERVVDKKIDQIKG